MQDVNIVSLKATIRLSLGLGLRRIINAIITN